MGYSHGPPAVANGRPRPFGMEFRSIVRTVTRARARVSKKGIRTEVVSVGKQVADFSEET